MIEAVASLRQFKFSIFNHQFSIDLPPASTREALTSFLFSISLILTN